METLEIREYLKKYGARLRDMRIKAKLIQLQVARFIGVSQAIISHIECGFFLPSDELESALLDIYNTEKGGYNMEYCYVVTCDDVISGACYHNFDNAIRFIENRSDKPKKISETNPFIWFSNQYVYKIHTLTFDDKEKTNNENAITGR